VPFTLRQHLPLSLQTNLAGLGDSAELLERGLFALGLGVGHLSLLNTVSSDKRNICGLAITHKC
jgi:hypothetical protein